MHPFVYKIADKLEARHIKKGINQGHCPDCGGTIFLDGPHGGSSANIRCAGCGSEFCFQYPFESERIDRNDPSLYHDPFDLRSWVSDWDEVLERKPTGKLPPWFWAYLVVAALMGSWWVSKHNWPGFFGNAVMVLVFTTLFLVAPWRRYHHNRYKNETKPNRSPARGLRAWMHRNQRQD